jgi:hypothetical protein
MVGPFVPMHSWCMQHQVTWCAWRCLPKRDSHVMLVLKVVYTQGRMNTLSLVLVVVSAQDRINTLSSQFTRYLGGCVCAGAHPEGGPAGRGAGGGGEGASKAEAHAARAARVHGERTELVKRDHAL